MSGGGGKLGSGVSVNLKPGKTYSCHFIASDGTTTLDGGETTFTSPSRLPACAETGGASLIGTGGATIFGSAGGTSLPTRTWFAWGREAGSVPTPTRRRPPRPARARRGAVPVIAFKPGPRTSDFRAALEQLLDYGADLWQMTFEEFEQAVAVRNFASDR